MVCVCTVVRVIMNCTFKSCKFYVNLGFKNVCPKVADFDSFVKSMDNFDYAHLKCYTQIIYVRVILINLTKQLQH